MRINDRRFKLVVDTGAPFTTFDHDMMRRAGLTAADTNMGGGIIGTHAQRMGLSQLPSLRIGDFRSGSVYITAQPGLRTSLGSKESSSSEAPMLGLLGGDFLARNNALVDVGEHALYLKGSDPTGAASLH